MEKQTKKDLLRLQSLPLDVKVHRTKTLIKQFVEGVSSEPYISFSGGKDSTVLLHIARQIYPDLKAVFIDTGLEYPEVRAFAMGFENVTVLKAEKTFRDVVTEYGYPIIGKEKAQCVMYYQKWLKSGKEKEPRTDILKILGEAPFDKSHPYNAIKYEPLGTAPFLVSNYCCSVMKKQPSEKLPSAKIIATLAQESARRKTAWMQTGCNLLDSDHPLSKPMSFWTEQDVLLYIKTNNLPIASVYGDIVAIDGDGYEYGSNLFDDMVQAFNHNLCTTGCDRTGCVFCAFGAHLEKGESRFERLHRTHPKLYNYCINGGGYDPEDGLWKPNAQGLGMGFVFDWCNEHINNFEIRY